MRPTNTNGSALSSERLHELRAAAEGLFKSKQRDLTNLAAKRANLAHVNEKQAELDALIQAVGCELTAYEARWEHTREVRIPEVQEAIALETAAIEQLDAATKVLRASVAKAALPLALHENSIIPEILQKMENAPEAKGTAEIAELEAKAAAHEAVIEAKQAAMAEIQTEAPDGPNGIATAKLMDFVASAQEKLDAVDCTLGGETSMEDDRTNLSKNANKIELEAIEAELRGLLEEQNRCGGLQKRLEAIEGSLWPVVQKAYEIHETTALLENKRTDQAMATSQLRVMTEDQEAAANKARTDVEALREKLSAVQKQATEMEAARDASAANTAIMEADIAAIDEKIAAVGAALEEQRKIAQDFEDDALPEKCADLEAAKAAAELQAMALNEENSEIEAQIALAKEELAAETERLEKLDNITNTLHAILTEIEVFFDSSEMQHKVAALGDELLEVWDTGARRQAKKRIEKCRSGEDSESMSSEVTADEIDREPIYAARRALLLNAVQCSHDFADGLRCALTKLEGPLTMTPRGAKIMQRARELLDCVANDALAAEVTTAQSVERCAHLRKELAEEYGE